MNRDTFIYAASIETSALDTAIKVLGEVILRPQLTPQEVSVSPVKFNETKSCIRIRFIYSFRSMMHVWRFHLN